MYDFLCKMCKNNTFFHCLCSALMEKYDFYCLLSLETVRYRTVQVLYFFIAQLSLGG